MVSADGSHAVLMDLGLAQLMDETEGRLTRTRQFVGTLRYASPEQVLAAGRMDRRTDVYSIGATLWELLTLRPLFGADDQTPTPELMERIQREDPERPRKHNPRVPADLEAIVVKCLEKDRARRYATATDLAADLGRWQRGEPVLAQPVGTVMRGIRWARRRSAVLAWFLLVLVAAIAVISLWSWGEQHCRAAARAVREREEIQRYLEELAPQQKESLRDFSGWIRQRPDLANMRFEDAFALYKDAHPGAATFPQAPAAGAGDTGDYVANILGD